MSVNGEESGCPWGLGDQVVLRGSWPTRRVGDVGTVVNMMERSAGKGWILLVEWKGGSRSGIHDDLVARIAD